MIEARRGDSLATPAAELSRKREARAEAARRVAEEHGGELCRLLQAAALAMRSDRDRLRRDGATSSRRRARGSEMHPMNARCDRDQTALVRVIEVSGVTSEIDRRAIEAGATAPVLLLILMAAACGSGVPGEPEIPGIDACAGVAVLAVEELVAARPGRRVAVDAVPVAFVDCAPPAGCGPATSMSIDEPVAARTVPRIPCPASYAIPLGGDEFAELAGLGGGCTVACDVECEPFGRHPERPYRFVGVYQTGPRLDVELVCALP